MYGTSLPAPLNLDVQEVYTNIWCENADGEKDDATDVSGWVPIPSPQAPVPDLLRWLAANLVEPSVTFPDRDAENRWLYVNTPMDFRIDPLFPNPVYKEKTVSNILGSATGWIRAEPTAIVFDSGEPDGETVTCSYAEATAPYDVETPGACSYVYSWSSGINDSGTFPLNIAVVWDITTSAPAIINRRITTYSEDIAVAEIQAIEVVR